MTSAAPLIACHDCDLLHREIDVPVGGRARCVRCGAILYAHPKNGLERALAFALAAAVLFVIANSFPIISLEIRGLQTEVTLFGAVAALWGEDMQAVAALVFLTAVAAPACELVAIAYLLVPLRFNRVVADIRPVFRVLTFARLWGMVDVFMLGVLVSLAKLANMASVVPGVALYSFAAVVLLMSAGASSFDGHELWIRVGKLR